MPFFISKLYEHYNTSLYKNAFFLMANTFLASILGFIFWIAAARFYAPADVGLAVAMISAANLLAVLSNLGFNFSVIKFLPKVKDFNRLANSCLTSVAVASFFLATAFLFFLSIFSPALLFVRENLIFAFAFLAFTMVWAISPLIDHIFVARRKSKWVLIRNTTFNVLKTPLAICFAAFSGAFGIFASWGIAMGISSGVALLFFIPRSLPRFRPMLTINRMIIKEMLHFSLGNYAAHLLYLAPGLLLPLMVLNLLGAQSNAYFYVAFMIAELLFIIPTAVSQSMFAEGSSRGERVGEYVGRSLRMIYSLMIPAIIVILILGDKLLLLFGSEYSGQGSGLLILFALSGMFLGVNLTYMTLLRLEKKVGEIIAISGFLALGILGLSYFLLIGTWGIVAVGYSWLAIHGIISVYAGWAIQSRV
jgi:O-antigen/teichoic acid export membrane protein